MTDTSREDSRSYLPAAGHDWFLPLYDPVVRLLGADRARKALVDQAVIRPGSRALEIGCGTGALVVRIKRLHPDVEVAGLDPDPKALARAERKARRATLPIRLDRGFSDALPYPGASFDLVFSSFMFHHLSAEEKEKTLRDVRRVLVPGGGLHLVDFLPGSGARGLLVRLLHPSDRLRDNSEERVLALMREAGFGDAAKVADGALLFGHLPYAFYRATRP